MITEKLDKLYYLATNSSDNRSFLISIYAYISEFFKNSLLTGYIEDVVVKTKNDDLHKREDLSEKLIIESKKMMDQIKSYIASKKVINKEAQHEIEMFDGLLDGSTHISGDYADNIAGQVTLALIRLNDLGNGENIDFTHKFARVDERGVIQDWTWSVIRPSYDDEVNRIERLKLTRPWFWWDNLSLVYEVYTNYEKLWKEQIDNHQIWSAYGLAGAMKELELLLDNKEPVHNVFFIPKELKQNLSLFHLHALEYISTNHLDDSTQIPDHTKDCGYEDFQFFVRLADGGIDNLDLTNSPVQRKIFEVFWGLWKSSGRQHYSKAEITGEYNKKFNDFVQASYIGKQIANIRKKMKNKPISNRLVWFFDKNTGDWVFEIKSLSQT